MHNTFRVVRRPGRIAGPERWVIAVQVDALQVIVRGQQVFIRTEHVLAAHPAVTGRELRVVRISTHPVPARESLGLQKAIDVQYRDNHDVGVVAQVTHQEIIVFGQRNEFDDTRSDFR